MNVVFFCVFTEKRIFIFKEIIYNYLTVPNEYTISLNYLRTYETVLTNLIIIGATEYFFHSASVPYHIVRRE